MANVRNALLLFLLSAPLAFPADNQLTPAETKAGWKLLFDGKTFNNWRDPAHETPAGDSWTIEDGCLTTLPKPRIEEDLISAKPYGDYELQFDWRVSPGGNTGVKYRIQEALFHDSSKPSHGSFEAGIEQELLHHPSDRTKMAPGAHGQEYTVAFEFQLIDDERHPDAKRGGTRVTGALYSMLQPSSHPAHPAGEWNSSRLVVKGNHVEHWVNGQKVLSGSLDDPEALANLKKRWANGPAIYESLAHAKKTGRFSLQNHGDKVWFKNVKIHEL